MAAPADGRRTLVGLATWVAVTLGASFAMHLLAPYQTIQVTAGIVAVLGIVAPQIAMRFVPRETMRPNALKLIFGYLFWAGGAAGVIGVALFDHWHEGLAVSNGSASNVTISVDGHDLGPMVAGGVESYKIPTGATEIVARAGEAVIDRDTLASAVGGGTLVFDVGGKGCFERRTVTYGSSFGFGHSRDIVEKLPMTPGHHVMRTTVDFLWHAESGVSVSKGESSARRDVLERCGHDD